MKKVKITENENVFIRGLIDLLDKEEGFSDVDVTDVANEIEMPVNKCKGIQSSLVKKGLIDPPDEDFAGLIYLNPRLYHYHPIWDINDTFYLPEDFEEVELITENK